MKVYKFRQPHKCQNGHFNYLYFELHGDRICNYKWGEFKCNCPKGGFYEGYYSCGDTELLTEEFDDNI